LRLGSKAKAPRQTPSAILLVAGDKSGVSEKKFYKRLIVKVDDRFDAHLARLKQKERK
jgi:hypothetical protein